MLKPVGLDRVALRRSFNEKRSGAQRADFLLAEVERRLDERLEPMRLDGVETVLDLGCGLGRSLPVLARRFPEAQVLALDMAEQPLIEQHRLDMRARRGLQGLLARIATCLSSYLPPAVRAERAPRVAQDLLDLARAAEPGGDKQLQLVRAVAAHAVTEEQTGAVAAWLDGSEALAGLVVDQDLRWDLLVGLVAAGRVDEAAIAAEEARDRTTTGRERAAQARAAVPTPQAKAAVWRELMENASMPNETQVKTLRGFNDVEHRPELLAPFVEEYARRILVIWETRTFHMAENLLSELWSTATVGLEGADPAGALEAWLAEHPDAPAALRRIVGENLDDTRRAALVQARESRG